MDIQKTSTRLRRTYPYPADDTSTDSQPEVLDEQEQEDLIAQLSDQNAARNGQFRNFLLSLPVLSTTPYLISLFQPGRANVLVAMLALSSLGSTAWILYALPPGITGIPVMDRWTSAKGDADSSLLQGGMDLRSMARKRTNSNFAILPEHQLPRSPLATYLPYLNMVLCAVLMLTGVISRSHAPQAWGHVGLGNLPAIVYAIVLMAKMVMASVDPEKELGELKYEYKGA